MDLGIKGKRVLVTGGCRGIGAAAAKAFAGEGCLVTVVARHEDDLKLVLKELGGEAKGHAYVVADLLKSGRPSEVAQALLQKNRTVDIVVHNVGGALEKKDPLGPIEDWSAVWQFNAGVAIEMNRILVPAMRRQGWGRVVHVSSISGELGEPLAEPFKGALPYAAAKAYLNAYIRGLGREMAHDNVIVTGVMPGAVLSEGKYWDKLSKENPELVGDFLTRFYPAGRFGKVDEIAPFIVLLASQQASFAAGSIMPISGGRV